MLLVWLLLALLVAVLVIGTWHVFVRTRGVFRALRESGGGISGALAEVDAAAARLADSAARAPERADAMTRSLARLARSRAELAVLTAAIGETADLGRSVRGLVPKK